MLPFVMFSMSYAVGTDSFSGCVDYSSSSRTEARV